MFHLFCRGKIQRIFLATSILALFLFGGIIQAVAQEITPEMFSALRYRHIGPMGNRTSAVCGEPGNSMVYYIGASSGGIWKSSQP